MKEEIKRWMKLADEDFDSAKINFYNKKYYVCAFLCQQCAEKSLKALFLKKKGSVPRVHDLVFLGKKIGLNEDILKDCDELSKVYIETRYPDAGEELPSEKFDKIKTKKFLEISEKILKWIKKNI